MLWAMDAMWRTVVGSQFEVAIEMLGTAVRDCPDELWQESMWDDKSMPGFSEFWYVAYHAMFWLDLYLSGSSEGFAPPAPFTLDELDPEGLMPERPFTKNELQIYLAHGRQ